MTRVDSVDNRSPYSVFGSITKGIIIGGSLGYMGKVMIPLQESEKNNEYRFTVAEIKNQSKKTKSIVIDEIRNMENRSLAQDVFLKMVDASEKKPSPYRRFKNTLSKVFLGKKTPEAAVHAGNMHKIIEKAGLDMKDKAELHNIISQINGKAKISAKRYLRAYDAAFKSMRRPGIAYITVGSVAGFFGGLAHKILQMSKVND